MAPESMADVTVRDGSDFEAILLLAWQGEIYGVRVYGALAESRGSATESQKLFELVELEQSMRDQLASVLDALNVPRDIGDVLQVAERDIAQQRSSTWSELLRWISADAAIALDEYLPLLDADLPPGSVASQVAERVVDHERAIVAFCTKELAGEIDALQDVRLLLAKFEGQ
jgi:hypothetical protein